MMLSVQRRLVKVVPRGARLFQVLSVTPPARWPAGHLASHAVAWLAFWIGRRDVLLLIANEFAPRDI